MARGDVLLDLRARLTLVGAGAVALAFALRDSVRWLRLGDADAPPLASGRGVAAWLSIPAVSLALLFAAELDLPLRIRIARSRPALERHAAAVLAGEIPEREPRRVKLFRVESARVEGGWVYLVTATAFAESGGVALAPGISSDCHVWRHSGFSGSMFASTPCAD